MFYDNIIYCLILVIFIWVFMSFSRNVNKRAGSTVNNPAPLKKAKTEDVVAIKVLKLEKFWEHLNKLDSKDACTRFKNLLSVCTPLQKGKTKVDHATWLMIPDGSKKGLSSYLTIRDNLFDSQCFHESHQDYPNNLPGKKKYSFITACHKDIPNTYYFQIRVDKKINIAEIIHIQKAESVSGNEIKQICMKIVQFLKPKKIFLNDDSKVTMGKFELSLRVVLPIVSDIPRTWYEGFKPFFFVDAKENDDEEVKYFSRPEIDYNGVVGILRETTLICMTDIKKHPQLKLMMGTYIPNYNKNSFKDYTVHQLGNGIYRALRGSNKEQASKDYVEFFKTYLDPNKINHAAYKDGLFNLYDYKIFVMEIN